MLAPITVKTPNHIASHFRKIFQCFFNRGYRKKIEKPVTMVRIKYIGSVNAAGGYSLKMTSRINPPASPVTLERITTPTMSAFCSIALNAPVIANATVPK